jgi:hypothetical protein
MLRSLYYGLLGIGYLLVIIPSIIVWRNGKKLNKENFTTTLFMPQCIGLILMFVGIMGAFSESTDPLVWQVMTVFTAASSVLYSLTSCVLSMNIIRWQAD